MWKVDLIFLDFFYLNQFQRRKFSYLFLNVLHVFPVNNVEHFTFLKVYSSSLLI